MTPLDQALGIILIILSVVVVILVLVQSKGADLGGFLGGGGGEGQVRTRRGVEALLHRVTIATFAIFFVYNLVLFYLWGL